MAHISGGHILLSSSADNSWFLPYVAFRQSQTNMATIAIGTLGVGSLAALAGGAALAGAIGLGVAGLAAKFHGRRRGGGGRSYGRRRGHHGYRGKRTVDDESAVVQNLLQVIEHEDVTGCGKKLVCELAGVEEQALLEEELAILDLIGPVVRPGEGVLPPGGATGVFADAKSLGIQRGNCNQAYPLCPLNGTEIMGAVMNYLP